MKSFEWRGLTYEWNGGPLDEFTRLRVITPGQPDRWVSLGSLIAMSNGDVLSVLPTA